MQIYSTLAFTFKVNFEVTVFILFIVTGTKEKSTLKELSHIFVIEIFVLNK